MLKFFFFFLREKERERENFGWEATRGWSRFFCTKQTAPFVLHKIHMLKKIHCVLYDTVSQCDGKSARPSVFFFLFFFSTLFQYSCSTWFFSSWLLSTLTNIYIWNNDIFGASWRQWRPTRLVQDIRETFIYLFFYYYYYWAASQTLVLSMFSVCVTLNDSVRACVT